MSPPHQAVTLMVTRSPTCEGLRAAAAHPWMAGSLATWRSGIHPLARNATVLAVDLPGQGGRARRRGLLLGSLASGLRDVLTALGHDRATLVGHSLGGGIAMQFSYQFPEMTERLVLVSSGGWDSRSTRRCAPRRCPAQTSFCPSQPKPRDWPPASRGVYSAPPTRLRGPALTNCAQLRLPGRRRSALRLPGHRAKCGRTQRSNRRRRRPALSGRRPPRPPHLGRRGSDHSGRARQGRACAHAAQHPCGVRRRSPLPPRRGATAVRHSAGGVLRQH